MKGGRIFQKAIHLSNLRSSKAKIVTTQCTSTTNLTRKRFFTRDEVCTNLNISKTTLNNYTRAGKLQKHCIGNRVLYKRSEVLGLLLNLLIINVMSNSRALFLHVRRRKWQVESSGHIISREWDITSKGARYTKGFAAFLKELFGQLPDKQQKP